jgi:hypothetical protein
MMSKFDVLTICLVVALLFVAHDAHAADPIPEKCKSILAPVKLTISGTSLECDKDLKDCRSKFTLDAKTPCKNLIAADYNCQVEYEYKQSGQDRFRNSSAAAAGIVPMVSGWGFKTVEVELSVPKDTVSVKRKSISCSIMSAM